MCVEKDIGDIVQKARSSLAELPVKPGHINWKTVASQLEEDFRQARAKGYGVKEISDVLKEVDIQMPAYLVKRFGKVRGLEDVPNQTKPKKQGVTGMDTHVTKQDREKSTTTPKAQSLTEAEDQTPEGSMRHENVHGTIKDDLFADQFTLTPDTPEGEL